MCRGRFHLAHLWDYGAVRPAAAGMDVVIHIAADPSGEGDGRVPQQQPHWRAKHLRGGARCRGEAGGLRQLDPPTISLLTETPMPRVYNLWPSLKVWGEALAQTYWLRHGMSYRVIRIWWVHAEDCPSNPRGRNQWCSQRDTA